MVLNCRVTVPSMVSVMPLWPSSPLLYIVCLCYPYMIIESIESIIIESIESFGRSVLLLQATHKYICDQVGQAILTSLYTVKNGVSFHWFKYGVALVSMVTSV